MPPIGSRAAARSAVCAMPRCRPSASHPSRNAPSAFRHQRSGSSGRASRRRTPPCHAITAIRVVEGAKQLSPASGERMLAATLLGKSVVRARAAAARSENRGRPSLARRGYYRRAVLAGVVGRAHASTARCRRETRVAGSRISVVTVQSALDAPGWFWRSVVDLAGHSRGRLSRSLPAVCARGNTPIARPPQVAVIGIVAVIPVRTFCQNCPAAIERANAILYLTTAFTCAL